VAVRGRTRTRTLHLTLPLRVRGHAQFSGGMVSVNDVVGGRGAVIRGKGVLRSLALAVEVPTPISFLRPPRQGSWRHLAARGRLHGGAAATALATRRLVSAALARQFHAFLADPDPGGFAKSSYEFRLGTTDSSEITGSSAPSSSGPWLPAIVAAALGVAAVAAVVVWAHA
jgi:hypothetical protein